MGMDNITKVWLVAANIVAAAVLLQRFSHTERGEEMVVRSKAWIANKLLADQRGSTCGLLHWENFTVVSNKVLLPGGLQPAAVYIERGKIVRIDPDISISGLHVLDFKDHVVFPGVIDVHAHLNEPGREDWEGMTTGTTAAAVGGVTTVIDMPLNSNPTATNGQRLLDKKEIAGKKAMVNVGFWGGLVPENAREQGTLMAMLNAGALGFKSFMCPSGINDFAHVVPADIAAALPFLKKQGVPLFVHAELVHEVEGTEGADPTQYTTYLASRPPSFERGAVEEVVKALDMDTTTAQPGFSVHVAHLADAGCLPIIAEARQRHPLTVETCAHYLAFSQGDIGRGQTHFKCAPPIRDQANREALLAAVASGEIALVSSDHSPAPPGLKEVESGDFVKAWGGISGLQYLLPATWTALKAQGASLSRLAQVLSEEPARLAGVGHRKGRLEVGYDADIVIWDPEKPANTSAAANRHRHKLSPYTDQALLGLVQATIVQGHMVTMFGAVSKAACGEVLVGRNK